MQDPALCWRCPWSRPACAVWLIRCSRRWPSSPCHEPLTALGRTLHSRGRRHSIARAFSPRREQHLRGKVAIFSFEVFLSISSRARLRRQFYMTSAARPRLDVFVPSWVSVDMLAVASRLFLARAARLVAKAFCAYLPSHPNLVSINSPSSGPSGAGKTTLLNALAARAPYALVESEVLLGDVVFTKRHLAYVPQFDAIPLDLLYTPRTPPSHLGSDRK